MTRYNPITDHRRKEIQILVNDLIEDVKQDPDDFNHRVINNTFSERVNEYDHVNYYSDSFSFLETPFITFEIIDVLNEYDYEIDFSNSCEIVNKFVRIVMNDIISSMNLEEIPV